MAGPAWIRQVLAVAKLAGPLVNNYTSAKRVINDTEVVPILGNETQLGTGFHIWAWGGLSNVVTAAPTVTFQVMMGTSVAWTSGALQLSTTANTLVPFVFDVTLFIRALPGSAGSAQLIGGGTITGISPQLGTGVANPTVTDSVLVLPAGAPTLQTAYDSTITQNLDFWAGFSAAATGNGVQIQGYVVEQIQY